MAPLAVRPLCPCACLCAVGPVIASPAPAALALWTVVSAFNTCQGGGGGGLWDDDGRRLWTGRDSSFIYLTMQGNHVRKNQ